MIKGVDKVKRFLCLILCCLILVGCSDNDKPSNAIRIDGDRVYYKLSDGIYKCNGNTYQYELKITGRPNNSAKKVTYIYLSNIENISFDEALKASGISSNLGDYFAPSDAILVKTVIKED